MSETLSGTVIRCTGNWSSVMLGNGDIVECNLRGQFRIKDIKTTNPVTVGDQVEISLDEQTNQGVIMHIEERKNYVIRKSVNLSKQAHIIASNLDQAVIIATVEQPRTSLGFIDRFLCTSEAYGIPAAVVFNKLDVYVSEKSKLKLNQYLSVYQSIGYRVFLTSTVTGEGIAELDEWMKDKRTLISGHSGVGKSSLINMLHPKLELKTGDISEVHSKGKHTTTFAEMFPLANGGFIIDTPGIKEFGMIDMQPYEVSHYFTEMFKVSKNCRFNNCTHQNEPNCAVKQAMEKGEIPESRYNSYINILESLQ
ncbi:ribosome small subunit-dependent GTPase A [Bacteroidota bacterium]